jgi:hypothetical protein
MSMVSRQPRLLLQEGAGVRQRLESVLDKLTSLHPSHNRAVITGGCMQRESASKQYNKLRLSC